MSAGMSIGMAGGVAVYLVTRMAITVFRTAVCVAIGMVRGVMGVSGF
jgi:hypothetical protein